MKCKSDTDTHCYHLIADHNLTDTEEDSCDDEDSDGEEDDGVNL